MDSATSKRCVELSEKAAADARSWVRNFSDDFAGKVGFCLALAHAVSAMQVLVPMLAGTGEDFISAVKAGVVLWVEMGEPATLAEAQKLEAK